MEYILIALIIIQQIFHNKERKDLYTRLMAKDLQEYTSMIDNSPPPKPKNPIKKRLDKLYERGDNS